MQWLDRMSLDTNDLLQCADVDQTLSHHHCLIWMCGRRDCHDRASSSFGWEWKSVGQSGRHEIGTVLEVGDDRLDGEKLGQDAPEMPQSVYCSTSVTRSCTREITYQSGIDDLRP